MKSNRRIVFTLATLTAALLAAGCQSNPFARNDDTVPVVDGGPGVGTTVEPAPMAPMAPVETGLPLATNTRFPDVPLPLGVKEDIDRTYVFESGGFRVGRMVYTSRDALADLGQFYIRECPVAGWTMNTAVQAEGIQLQFMKGGEKLDVSVRSPGVGRANELILHLTPSEGAGSL